MAKDPAFLFYSSDFLNGVADLTMEERGQYITMLCLQHQKGSLSEKTIRLSVGSVSVDVMVKFKKDENGNYFQDRLNEEMEKRSQFIDSRRLNGLKGGRPKSIPKPSAKPTGKPNAKALAKLLEDVNEDVVLNEYEMCVRFWLKEFHQDFQFDAMSGKKMKSIIEKIKKLLIARKKEITDKSVFETFKLICQKLPEWYQDKDLAIIDSKFNEVIEQIKKPKPQILNNDNSNRFTRAVATANKVIADLTGSLPVDQGPIQS